MKKSYESGKILGEAEGKSDGYFGTGLNNKIYISFDDIYNEKYYSDSDHGDWYDQTIEINEDFKKEFIKGYKDGYNEAYEQGHIEWANEGYDIGYGEGLIDFEIGKKSRINELISDERGERIEYNEGYEEGYEDGYNGHYNSDSSETVIKKKIKKMKTKIKKHDPIICMKEKTQLKEFFVMARELKLSYIIYVKDSEGINNRVWATSKQDLVRCFTFFSKNNCFGRIERLETAIKSGFADSINYNLN